MSVKAGKPFNIELSPCADCKKWSDKSGECSIKKGTGCERWREWFSKSWAIVTGRVKTEDDA